MRASLKHFLYRSIASRAKGERTRGVAARACKRVLLCEISLLGDAVSFTAAIAPARRLWPEARLDVLVNREYAALFDERPDIDEIVKLGGMDVGAYASALLAVRAKRYDLVVAMSPGLRNAGMAILGTSGACAGYLIDERYPPQFLNAQIVDSFGVELAREFVSDSSTHLVDRALGPLRALGALVEDSAAPLVRVSDAARERVDDWLRSRGMDSGRFAAMHPSASEAVRRWPADGFASLGRALADEFGLGIVLLGETGDSALVDRAAPEDEHHRFVGRGLDELAALLSRAALFVGNDSGPMHLAGAMGAPLVGIFGPGDPARLLPRGANALSVGGPDLPGGVAAVHLDEVLEACREVMRKGRVS